MKKLFLFAIPLLMLAACSGSQNKCTNVSGQDAEKREKNNLSLDNYSKYIATYTISDSYGADYTYSCYRYQFIGSSLCKFTDATIVYAFAKENGDVSITHYTTNLTISGCGETDEVRFINTQRNQTYYRLTIISVSGSVEVLY